MKKQAKNILKNMSEAELIAHADLLRSELFSSRLQAASKPQKDIKAKNKMRKEVARTLTYLHQMRTAA